MYRQDQGAALSSKLVDYDQKTNYQLSSSTNSFKGEVIVRADSNIQSLADQRARRLRHKSNSASGYIYLAEMKDAGNPATTDTIVTVNDIPSEITAVLNGQVMRHLYLERLHVIFSKISKEQMILFKDLKVLYLTKGVIFQMMRLQYCQQWMKERAEIKEIIPKYESR